MKELIKDIKLKRLILKRTVPVYKTIKTGNDSFKRITNFLNCNFDEIREIQIDYLDENDPLLIFFQEKINKGLFFERQDECGYNRTKYEFYRSYVVKCSYFNDGWFAGDSIFFNINMLDKEIPI